MKEDNNKFDTESNEKINDSLPKEESVNKELNTEDTINECCEKLIDDFTEEEEIEMKEVIEGSKNNKKCGFFKKLLAGIIDQAITLALSLAIFFIFNFLLKFVGYMVAERVPVYFVIYVAVNILYTAIMETTKLKATIGNKVVNK